MLTTRISYTYIDVRVVIYFVSEQWKNIKFIVCVFHEYCGNVFNTIHNFLLSSEIRGFRYAIFPKWLEYLVANGTSCVIMC